MAKDQRKKYEVYINVESLVSVNIRANTFEEALKEASELRPEDVVTIIDGVEQNSDIGITGLFEI